MKNKKRKETGIVYIIIAILGIAFSIGIVHFVWGLPNWWVLTLNFAVFLIAGIIILIIYWNEDRGKDNNNNENASRKEE